MEVIVGVFESFPHTNLSTRNLLSGHVYLRATYSCDLVADGKGKVHLPLVEG